MYLISLVCGLLRHNWCLLGLVLFPYFAHADFSFKDLEALISGKELTSIESVLPLLPVELRENWTLMHHSRSTQGASPASPRVIMFGNDGKLIITFNGGPPQEGGNSLEIQEVDQETKKPIYREIVFDPPAKARISSRDPDKCLSCHEHPNWEPYRFWVGAYGGDDDRITAGYSETSPFRHHDVDGVHLKSFNEQANYKAFRKKAKTHPRYSQLIFKNPEREAAPYNALDTEKELETDRNAIYKYQPNTKLTQLLSAQHMERVYQELKTSPFYEKYKSAFVFLYTCSDPLTLSNERSRIFAEIKKDFNRLGKYFLGKPWVGPWTEEDTSTFENSNYRFLTILDLLGVSDEKYWMGFRNYDRKNSHLYPGMNYQTGSGGQYGSLAGHFLTDLQRQHFDLNTQEFLDGFGLKHVHVNDLEVACPILADRALQALSHQAAQSEAVCAPTQGAPLSDQGAAAILGVVSALSPRVPLKPGKIFGRCTYCHEKDSRVSIPFLASVKFKSRLLENDKSLYKDIIYRTSTKNSDKQMPPTFPLADPERTEMIQYLDELIRAPGS